MTTEVPSWHPVSETELAHAKASIEKIVNQWHTRWVGHGDVLMITSVYPHSEALTTLRDEDVWRVDDCLKIDASRAGLQEFAGMALRLSTNTAMNGIRANEVIEHVRSDMTLDLLREIAKALGCEATHIQACPPFSNEPGFRSRDMVVIRCAQDGHTPWLTLHVDSSLLRAPRRPMKAASPSLTPLSPISDLVVNHRLKVAAMLGQCQLTAKDVRTLAVGDVLGTSRTLDAPIDLVLIQVGKQASPPLAHGMPGQSKKHYSIQITNCRVTTNHESA